MPKIKLMVKTSEVPSGMIFKHNGENYKRSGEVIHCEDGDIRKDIRTDCLGYVELPLELLSDLLSVKEIETIFRKCLFLQLDSYDTGDLVKAIDYVRDH